MQAGASEAKIRAVPESATSALFTERERAALAYAEAMTVTGQQVTDDLFARVRAKQREELLREQKRQQGQ